jgi:hypothetical protein
VFFRNADESQSHQDSQKDQRSRPLTLRNSSKSGGSVSSGGGATVVIGSSTVKNLDHWIRVQTGGTSAQERNRSHPLDLSAKDQQPLDPVELQGG